MKEDPDAAICSVGGGGLFCGIMLSLLARGGAIRDFVAVQTTGDASLAQSLEEGRLINLKRITSMATSLGATRVAERTLQYIQLRSVLSVVLLDAEAAMACWRLADDERFSGSRRAGL